MTLLDVGFPSFFRLHRAARRRTATRRLRGRAAQPVSTQLIQIAVRRLYDDSVLDVRDARRIAGGALG